jgi:putative tryptophan/tyrosine transport system substrate-binding protein
MRRRQFIALLGGMAFARPTITRAQQVARVRQISVLMPFTESDLEGRARVAALQLGLEQLGWNEGRNINTNYRWFGGDVARAKAYAKEIVGLQPDAIIANGTVALSALQHTTKTIPIIFLVVNDPVGQGFISSLAHPGGNITGLTSFEYEIGGKWLQLLKEIVPDLSRVSVIYNPEAGPYAINLMRSMTAIGPSADLIATPIRNISEIESAVASLATGSRAGLIVNPDGFMVANHSLIVSVAARFSLPAIYPYRYFAAEGGLLSYGHPTVDVFRQGAVYVNKILHGAKPADVAVEGPTRYELVINQKTAKTLGLTIPADLLARGDEVIE